MSPARLSCSGGDLLMSDLKQRATSHELRPIVHSLFAFIILMGDIFLNAHNSQLTTHHSRFTSIIPFSNSSPGLPSPL